MRYTLDTNACLLLLSGHPRVAARAAQCRADDLAISTIVFAEVMIGIERGKTPTVKGLERLLTKATLLPFDEAAARAYSRLPFKRGSFDRLIAAHAIAAGLTLVTANEADFASLPGLTYENWAK